MVKFSVAVAFCALTAACSNSSSEGKSDTLVAKVKHAQSECPALSGKFQLRNSSRPVFSIIAQNESGNLVIQFDTSDPLIIDGTKQTSGETSLVGVCNENSIVVVSSDSDERLTIKPTLDGFAVTQGNTVAEYVRVGTNQVSSPNNVDHLQRVLTEIGTHLHVTVKESEQRRSWSSLFMYSEGKYMGDGANLPADGNICIVASYFHGRSSESHLHPGEYPVKAVNRESRRLWFTELEDTEIQLKYLTCSERRGGQDVRELSLLEAQQTLGTGIQVSVH